MRLRSGLDQPKVRQKAEAMFRLLQLPLVLPGKCVSFETVKLSRFFWFSPWNLRRLMDSFWFHAMVILLLLLLLLLLLGEIDAGNFGGWFLDFWVDTGYWQLLLGEGSNSYCIPTDRFVCPRPYSFAFENGPKTLENSTWKPKKITQLEIRKIIWTKPPWLWGSKCLFFSRVYFQKEIYIIFQPGAIFLVSGRVDLKNL